MRLDSSATTCGAGFGTCSAPRRHARAGDGLHYSRKHTNYCLLAVFAAAHFDLGVRYLRSEIEAILNAFGLIASAASRRTSECRPAECAVDCRSGDLGSRVGLPLHDEVLRRRHCGSYSTFDLS